MTSEWLKVMLDEVARKKSEAEAARAEQERRRADVVESSNSAPRKKIGDAD